MSLVLTFIYYIYKLKALFFMMYFEKEPWLQT